MGFADAALLATNKILDKIDPFDNATRINFATKIFGSSQKMLWMFPYGDDKFFTMCPASKKNAGEITVGDYPSASNPAELDGKLLSVCIPPSVASVFAHFPGTSLEEISPFLESDTVYILFDPEMDGVQCGAHLSKKLIGSILKTCETYGTIPCIMEPFWFFMTRVFNNMLKNRLIQGSEDGRILSFISENGVFHICAVANNLPVVQSWTNSNSNKGFSLTLKGLAQSLRNVRKTIDMNSSMVVFADTSEEVSNTLSRVKEITASFGLSTELHPYRESLKWGFI